MSQFHWKRRSIVGSDKKCRKAGEFVDCHLPYIEIRIPVCFDTPVAGSSVTAARVAELLSRCIGFRPATSHGRRSVGLYNPKVCLPVIDGPVRQQTRWNRP